MSPGRSSGSNIAVRIDRTQGRLGFGEPYEIGNPFPWDPAENLEIGFEFAYAKIDQRPAHDVNQAATALPAGVSRNPDAFEARMRIERDF